MTNHVKIICHFDQSILISWQWLVYSDYRFISWLKLRDYDLYVCYKGKLNTRIWYKWGAYNSNRSIENNRRSVNVRVRMGSRFRFQMVKTEFFSVKEPKTATLNLIILYNCQQIYMYTLQWPYKFCSDPPLLTSKKQEYASHFFLRVCFHNSNIGKTSSILAQVTRAWHRWVHFTILSN